jgi:hypothetical protein
MGGAGCKEQINEEEQDRGEGTWLGRRSKIEGRAHGVSEVAAVPSSIERCTPGLPLS